MNFKRLTANSPKCATVACPAIYNKKENDSVIVVGKKIDTNETELDDEVADDEAAVKVTKEMIKQAASEL